MHTRLNAGLTHFTLGAAFALMSLTSQAAVTVSADLEPAAHLEQYNFSSGALSSNAFNDYFMITLIDDRNIVGSLSGTSNSNIKFTAFNLLAANQTTVLATGTLTNMGKLAFGGFDTNGQAGASYWINIVGTKLNNASYAGTLSLSPVPEAETSAMVLLGLGMVGMIVRRRQTGLAA